MEKPVLFGEFALSPGGDIQKDYDPEGIEFHNQLWASLLLKSLGTAMHWTWGSYVDKNRLYSEYLPVSRFFAGEDLRRTVSFSNLDAVTERLLILGLRKTDRACLWIKKRDWGFCQANAGKNPLVEKGNTAEIQVWEPETTRWNFMIPKPERYWRKYGNRRRRNADAASAWLFRGFSGQAKA